MADNRISSSKREIYTKFLDVMEKYDSDLENDDYAKTGLVGWLFEINAMMMRDSTYHKTVLYNEHFLNTAQIPKTVYNYAKMFNVEIEKATPAYADANIIIPRTEAEAVATTNANNRIVLNRDDQIYAGDYEFALEHSIEIHYDENTKMFTARYMTPAEEGKTTTFQQLNNYSINIRSDGENIIIPVRLFQYRINKYNTQIITNTFLNKIQTYKFEDQFCGIRLFSQKNKELVNIPVVYSELDNTESNYALYNLDDEHELELIFKEGDEYFTPAPNSNIIVYIYTTKGENVPKQFAGDAVMQISNTDLKTLPLVIQFNPTDIIGGVNSASITKLKQKIINEISISHTIVTQADLDDYFNKIITVINEINDGNIKFIKRRDDIIRRIFDSYLLLRDRTDDSVNSIKIKSDNKYISPCVPTNSVDVLINTNNLLSANGIINLINPKFSISNEATVDNEIYNYTIETATNPAEYICPFNMYIYNKDFQFVKYIYTAVDSSSEVYFANDNNNIYITDALASER